MEYIRYSHFVVFRGESQDEYLARMANLVRRETARFSPDQHRMTRCLALADGRSASRLLNCAANLRVAQSIFLLDCLARIERELKQRFGETACCAVAYTTH